MAVKKENLALSDQKALREFVMYLHGSIPEKIKLVVLFGSKARGESKQDSDIDVLVILTQEDRELRRKILKQAARFSLEYDVLLSPRVIGVERWEEMRGFSLYQNIERDATSLGIKGDELSFQPV